MGAKIHLKSDFFCNLSDNSLFMKLFTLFIGLIVVSGICFVSCDKQPSYIPQGGNIPTNYIRILDSSYSPSQLTVALGSSITFANVSSLTHTIVSDDSAFIVSPAILPSSSYYFKKDTLGTFSYHCREHPNVRGTITIRP